MKPSTVLGISGVFLTAALAAGGTQLQRVDESVRVPGVSVEQLAGASAPFVIDVRLKEDFDADPVLIEGARWKDPQATDSWAKELSLETEVVVYCVKGKWVSQSVTKRLRDLGLNVVQLEGGIEAWKAAGKKTTPVKQP